MLRGGVGRPWLPRYCGDNHGRRAADDQHQQDTDSTHEIPSSSSPRFGRWAAHRHGIANGPPIVATTAMGTPSDHDNSDGPVYVTTNGPVDAESLSHPIGGVRPIRIGPPAVCCRTRSPAIATILAVQIAEPDLVQSFTHDGVRDIDLVVTHIHLCSKRLIGPSCRLTMTSITLRNGARIGERSHILNVQTISCGILERSHQRRFLAGRPATTDALGPPSATDSPFQQKRCRHHLNRCRDGSY